MLYTKIFLSKMFPMRLTEFVRRPKLVSSIHKSIHTKSIRELLDMDEARIDQSKLRVVGWVKSIRDHRDIKFVHLNDGSDLRSLQLVFLNNNLKDDNVNKQMEKSFNELSFNTAIEVEGVLSKSIHKRQNVELHVTSLNVLGPCDANDYPFKAKGKYSLEQLRNHVHLRSHMTQFATIMKFRSELIMNIHKAFHDNRFTQVHTPILTSNNCEGGCETFQIHSNDKDDGLLKCTTDDFNTTKNNQQDNNIPDESKKLFFSKPVYLTASAQLHLESMTTMLGNVYTLSPTFRAEKSLTRHHLAEFYMLEAELIDINNLEQLLDFSENFLKRVCIDTFEKFSINELESISPNIQNNQKLPKRIEFLVDLLKTKKFVRITYKEAIMILNELLKKHKISSKLTKKSILYGEDLNKEQEKLLVEHFEKIPVFIIEYPKSIKPFYMRQNLNEPSLVDNFDLLVPDVGEIIGGSLREFRNDLLMQSIKNNNLNIRDFEYYLETKKFGAMRMGGFGIGLERLIQFMLNIDNIRDTCAFPRYLYNCKM